MSHWCTVARKLADGSMNLAARDVVAEDVSLSHSYQFYPISLGNLTDTSLSPYTG